jgi:hypothetical protein
MRRGSEFLNGCGFALSFIAMATMSGVFAGEPLATDSDFEFSLDTGGSPYVVASAGEALVVYLAGESIEITAPDGSSSTPVSSAASDGTYAWTPTESGIWTMTNDGEGCATFKVYYSLSPSSAGAGTESDPVKAIDGSDLAALVSGGYASDGSYFTTGGASIEDFVQPEGFAFREENGIFRLVASVNGLLYAGADFVFQADTRLPGPDRRMKKREFMPLAYSGDFWTGTNAAATATLAIYDPSGASAVQVVSGLDSIVFAPNVAGEWTITLSDGTTTLTSLVNVESGGFILTVR